MFLENSGQCTVILSLQKSLYSEDSNLHKYQRAGRYDMFVKVDADIRHGLGQLVSNDTADHASTKSDSNLGGFKAPTSFFSHFIFFHSPLLIHLLFPV